jgi:hypothetical protein
MSFFYDKDGCKKLHYAGLAPGSRYITYVSNLLRNQHVTIEEPDFNYPKSYYSLDVLNAMDNYLTSIYGRWDTLMYKNAQWDAFIHCQPLLKYSEGLEKLFHYVLYVDNTLLSKKDYERYREEYIIEENILKDSLRIERCKVSPPRKKCKILPNSVASNDMSFNMDDIIFSYQPTQTYNEDEDDDASKSDSQNAAKVASDAKETRLGDIEDQHEPAMNNDDIDDIVQVVNFMKELEEKQRLEASAKLNARLDAIIEKNKDLPTPTNSSFFRACEGINWQSPPRFSALDEFQQLCHKPTSNQLDAMDVPDAISEAGEASADDIYNSSFIQLPASAPAKEQPMRSDSIQIFKVKEAEPTKTTRRDVISISSDSTSEDEQQQVAKVDKAAKAAASAAKAAAKKEYKEMTRIKMRAIKRTTQSFHIAARPHVSSDDDESSDDAENEQPLQKKKNPKK